MVDRDNYERSVGAAADVLIDAAGSSNRRASERDGRGSFARNVLRVIDAIRDFSFDRYILISSTSIYPPGGSTDEDTLIDPTRLGTYGRHKWIAEQVVRANTPAWSILRLGPLVGPGLRKNSIFDLLERRRLFVHPDSSLSFVDTRTVGRIVAQAFNENLGVLNIAGVGSVRLRDIASDLGIALDRDFDLLPRDDAVIDATRAHRLFGVPDSAEAVRSFIREWRARSQ